MLVPAGAFPLVVMAQKGPAGDFVRFVNFWGSRHQKAYGLFFLRRAVGKRVARVILYVAENGLFFGKCARIVQVNAGVLDHLGEMLVDLERPGQGAHLAFQREPNIKRQGRERVGQGFPAGGVCREGLIEARMRPGTGPVGAPRRVRLGGVGGQRQGHQATKVKSNGRSHGHLPFRRHLATVALPASTRRLFGLGAVLRMYAPRVMGTRSPHRCVA